MSNVVIKLVFREQSEGKNRVFKEEVLKERSLKLKFDLEKMPAPADGSPKHLTINASFGPMGLLLDQLAERGRKADFKVHFANLSIEHVGMLVEAVEILGIEPRQDDIRSHLRGAISHDKLTAQQICTFHRIFYESRDVAHPNENKTIWQVLVHHTAWNIDQGKLTQAELDAIEMQTKVQHPELAAAIEAKILDLKQRRANYIEAKESAKHRQRMKAINTQVTANKKEQRARKEEELHGDVRELSEGMAQAVLTRAPAAVTAVVQDGKHGKRNLPGQGKRWRRVKEERADGKGGEE